MKILAIARYEVVCALCKMQMDQSAATAAVCQTEGCEQCGIKAELPLLELEPLHMHTVEYIYSPDNLDAIEVFCKCGERAVWSRLEARKTNRKFPFGWVEKG